MPKLPGGQVPPRGRGVIVVHHGGTEDTEKDIKANQPQIDVDFVSSVGGYLPELPPGVDELFRSSGAFPADPGQ